MAGVRQGGRHRGGSASPSGGTLDDALEALWRILDRWRHIEADFAREYPIDLTDPGGLHVVSDRTVACTPPMGGLTWRRFQVLLAGLSATSRYAASMRDPKTGEPIRYATAAEGREVFKAIGR